ncbi:hypothetical protein [Clostridium sp. YIM B02551]|uniref:hypothetical protein n=1 Tax=Clostridium sp. YIM B02551 TaxID=2910679 RepID=UPI001EEA02CB|nr:hypothetical protein [Clostridium sp. YIM B02551]
MQINFEISKSDFIRAQCDYIFNSSSYIFSKVSFISILPFLAALIVYIGDLKIGLIGFAICLIVIYTIFIPIGPIIFKYIITRTVNKKYIFLERSIKISISLNPEAIKVTYSNAKLEFDWSSVLKVVETYRYFHFYTTTIVNERLFIPRNNENKQLIIDILKKNLPDDRFSSIKEKRNIFSAAEDYKRFKNLFNDFK